MARRSSCLHLPALVLVLASTVSSAAPGRPYRVPSVALPPSPPPPPVVFLRDPEVPAAAAEGVMRRGTLVLGGPVDKQKFLVPKDLPLVTAEGQRVTSEDLLGLSLPFSRLSLDQDNIPPIPAGAEGYRRRPTAPTPQPLPPPTPYDVDSLGLGRTFSSEPVSDPGESLPRPSPPSPNTIVTYYALQPASAATSQTASVKMLPYLSLVESLVGKEAYRWPAPQPPVPARPVPTSTQVRVDPVSRPAAVYGGPGRGVYV